MTTGGKRGRASGDQHVEADTSKSDIAAANVASNEAGV
jgi:hypothetical protein